MSYAAQAYARAAQHASSPRDIEAQALLKAARMLQDSVANWDQPDCGIWKALMFNRKLWAIFVGDAVDDKNPEKIETREKIANLGIFVLSQSAALQVKPELERVQALIEINREIAAGLGGRV